MLSDVLIYKYQSVASCKYNLFHRQYNISWTQNNYSTDNNLSWTMIYLDLELGADYPFWKLKNLVCRMFNFIIIFLLTQTIFNKEIFLGIIHPNGSKPGALQVDIISQGGWSVLDS